MGLGGPVGDFTSKEGTAQHNIHLSCLDPRASYVKFILSGTKLLHNSK